MSRLLWKYYFQDDLEAFQQVLANATYSGANTKSMYGTGNVSAVASSPGRGLATSPVLKSKAKGRQSAGPVLTRAELNWKDSYGRTLLHHMATSNSARSTEFAVSLLEAPLLDLYAQDLENGWTPLHRALYYGNVGIARALMAKDVQDAVGTMGATHAGGLIKIKDKDGNSPFDVYNDTIAARILDHGIDEPTLPAMDPSIDDFSETDNEAQEAHSHAGISMNALDGEEVYTFGSNKNYNLGFVDGDDRHFPDKPPIHRPASLLHKHHDEHVANMTENALRRQDSKFSDSSSIPSVVRSRPLRITDVQLAKLHSAILTNDSESNLYVCGFGPGYRLGTGDEQTRFSFTSITGGGLGSKRIVSVALGLNHTIAVTSEGKTYSWGSNAFGQLGYALAKETLKEEEKIQAYPRQIFGSLKQEFVIGCAASRTHSVVHTRTSLFTFGKNEGQLGLVDADARSLELQFTPRQVALSRFYSGIVMVSAIDKATTCLLENHDVLVFANYGYSRLQLPLDSFNDIFRRCTFFGARPEGHDNHVIKIRSGGSTICALTSEGEVLTVAVKSEPSPNATSTTNPSKIRDSLSATRKLWSIRKSSMAAKDVDVGQDGSVIICTTGGSVWRREKRAKIKDDSSGHIKDYKFSRVPGLTRIVAVRSNAFGAFAAVRKDCDVMKTQVAIEPRKLWRDIFMLLPLSGLIPSKHQGSERLATWKQKSTPYDPAAIRTAIVRSQDLEKDLASAIDRLGPFNESTYDLQLGTTLSDLRIPVHSFLLAARSSVLRAGLDVFAREYYFSIPGVLSMEYDATGHPVIIFQGWDILSLLALVFYLYTDGILDVWLITKSIPSLAYASRHARMELMKLASLLGLKDLESAARIMTDPGKVLDKDLDRAIADPRFFVSGDIEVQLDGSSRLVHSALLCQRCPFFQGLFFGRAAGGWLSRRREELGESNDPINVDLQHIKPAIFDMVLRHLYADIEEDLFEDVVATDLDEFLDLILDVMAVANELLLDRLAQICQKVLGSFVTTRNVCQLLNVVAPCSVTVFKNVALEYLCLNLESMLENGLLDELDDELMVELDEMVQANQSALMPVPRSKAAEADLLERYPELADQLVRARQTLIDSVAMHSRLREDEAWAGKMARRNSTTSRSPRLLARASSSDHLFDMDEEDQPGSPLESSTGSPAARRKLSTTPEPSRRRSDLGNNAISESYEIQDDEPLSGRYPTAGTPGSPGASVSSPSFQVSSSIPWGSGSLNTPKLDMKQIMAQASEVRQSGISAAIAKSAGPSKESSTVKMSQKERKRQQQQLRQETIESMSSDTSDQNKTSKQFTWQVVSTGPRISLNDIARQEVVAASPSIQPSAPRSYTSPSLNLRQTVSGKVPTDRKEFKDTVPRTPPQVSRSVSQPLAGTPRPQQAAANTSTPTPTKPHSIRHTIPSTSSEPSLQLSMDDILAQQQQEKRLLKEANAKRSLLEIQEEQAFQDWWDKEAAATKARMQEEEEEAAAASQASLAKPGKEQGSRTRSHGRKEGKRGGGGGGSGGGGKGAKHTPSATDRAGPAPGNGAQSSVLPRTPDKSHNHRHYAATERTSDRASGTGNGNGSGSSSSNRPSSNRRGGRRGGPLSA